MSLTGPLFLGLVACVTLACFVAVVVYWPRLAGGDAGRVAARAGLLLGVNLLVLLAAAALLNAQFLFFADWADLRGALSGATATSTLARGGSAAQAAGRSVPGPAAVPAASLPPMPTGAAGTGGVITYTVNGPLSGVTANVVVQLPPGYRDAANATARYPVIETFQGYPGKPTQWIRSMDVGGVMAATVAAHRMRPALIVSPQVEIPPGVDTECVNASPGRPQLETWLAQDVPNWIVRTFRVQPGRSSWATLGLSAGGWCAAMVAMLHPAQYAAAVVMGGYFRPSFGSAYEPYPNTSPLESRYNLVRLAARKPPSVAV